MPIGLWVSGHLGWSMKKLYFLTQPGMQSTVSGKWRNRLKNTYKSTDAIRDVIDWAAQGREFYVALIDHEAETRRVFHMNPPGCPEIATDFATKRPVVGVIDQILKLCQSNRDVDIYLLERKRGGKSRREPPRDPWDGPNIAA